MRLLQDEGTFCGLDLHARTHRVPASYFSKFALALEARFIYVRTGVNRLHRGTIGCTL